MTDAGTGIQVVLVVNGTYGRSLLTAAETLVGPLGARVVEVQQGERGGEVWQQISHLIEQQGGKGTVLLLTDLCGSTPANVCLELLGRHPAWEMLTGLNLAMLLKLATCDRRSNASEMAEQLRRSARRSIRLGSELLGEDVPCGD